MLLLTGIFFASCFLKVQSSATTNNTLRRKSGAEEYSRRTIRGREMLMDNLRRFHNGEEPVKMIKPVEQPSNFKVPDDAILEVASYLTLGELKAFGIVSRFTNQIQGQAINHRLLAFNKYYVFEEQWLNDLIFSIIKKNFRRGKLSLEDPHVYDFVEYLTLHFIKSRDNLRNQLPKNVFRSILTFFHETIYGPGAYVPTSVTGWEFNFALKLDKFKNFPYTRGYYEHSLGRRTEYNDSRDERFDLLLNFLAQGKTLAEKRERAAGVLNSYGYGRRQFELFLNTDWSVPESMSEAEALELMQAIGELYICSNDIWAKLGRVASLSPELRDSTAETLFLGLQSRHYHSYFRASSDAEALDTSSYISTRDLNNPFNIEEIQRFEDFDPSRVVYELSGYNIPFLVKLDMLSKLIRSFPITFGRYLPDYSWDGISIEELLLLESPRLSQNQETEFPKNNPLALLLHSYTYLPKRTPKIIGKYNLNVSYRFDAGSSTDSGILGDIASFLGGKTLTFRRILYKLRDYRSYRDFSEAFGLYHPEHFKESEDDVESYPIYSVREYLENPNSII